jgi:acetoin utilization deacetylase AcuC-like enzyme
MKIFYDPLQKNHILTHEIISGKRLRHHEKRARIEVILRNLKNKTGFELSAPKQVPKEALYAVHDEGYIKFLENSSNLGKDEVIWPYVFPCDVRLPVLEPVTALTAGAYCFDVGTPIMADTWSAALAAASGAYSAAQHTKTTGETCYALARPPGHHASADKFGGYCYLNHAAIAARYLSQYGKVLIIDFDFHHGNGTQSIFYDSADVFYLSFHANPLHEYPYFTGHAFEKGIDDGVGFNLNVPLERNTGSQTYLDTFRRTTDAVVMEMEPSFLVISCGFDIAEGDPLGHFGLSPQDFQALGTHIKRFNKPTTLVQEGGYFIEKLGENVESFLSAFLIP